jgi:hypothetical protein
LEVLGIFGTSLGVIFLFQNVHWTMSHICLTRTLEFAVTSSRGAGLVGAAHKYAESIFDMRDIERTHSMYTGEQGAGPFTAVVAG